jgi:hypothetical protein
MLPIPKNLVLMSMMEAALRQVSVVVRDRAMNSQKDFDEESTISSNLLDEEDEDEEYNLDKIISGLATLSGPCGTYAVKADNELCVVPLDPRRKTSKSTDEEKKHDEINVELPFALHAGQTLQVVNFEDGVAKLARGAGYVVASFRQLVKGM